MEKESENFSKVQQILRRYRGEPNLVVTMENKWADFNLDSLDTVDLVMEIEEALGIQIEMSPEIKTVGDLMIVIDKLTGAK
jgi:acyl carrier protein